MPVVFCIDDQHTVVGIEEALGEEVPQLLLAVPHDRLGRFDAERPPSAKGDLALRVRRTAERFGADRPRRGHPLAEIITRFGRRIRQNARGQYGQPKNQTVLHSLRILPKPAHSRTISTVRDETAFAAAGSRNCRAKPNVPTRAAE